MKTDLYNLGGEKVGSVDLPDKIFAHKWSPQLVHQALLAQVANSRVAIAHAKGRDEVAGGGKKPWRQKGTGRARHGSIRSPLWKGGGVSHGPTKERNFSIKLNKKMKQGAIFSVLSKKLKDGEIRVIESLVFESPKTKEAYAFLTKFSASEAGKKSSVSALLIPAPDNRLVYRTARNIPKTKTINPKSMNVYDLLRYKNIFIDKGAVSAMEETYTK